MRIDKYIWTVRLFKTRSLASKECNANKVLLNDNFVKPSKEVKTGDHFSIRIAPIWKSFKILDFPKSRVGAKLVAVFLVETTSEEDLETLHISQEMQRQMRADGFKGRPTKRDRRKLDGFK
ncbi:MAG: RNA-binding S4 domain-containing protein [Flavobacteriales bacterium]|nr:RNA-binding S4 domain-containing protein [Flavobacteriales bacterium]